MKYGPITCCQNIKQLYSPHSFNNPKRCAFFSPSATPAATVYRSTAQFGNRELAGTRLAKLQHGSGQKKNEIDRQSIFSLIDKLSPAAKHQSILLVLLHLNVYKATWMQTLEIKFLQNSIVHQMLDCRIWARGCKTGATLQRKKIALKLPNISNSQRDCSRKANAALKKKSLLKTWLNYS